MIVSDFNASRYCISFGILIRRRRSLISAQGSMIIYCSELQRELVRHQFEILIRRRCSLISAQGSMIIYCSELQRELVRHQFEILIRRRRSLISARGSKRSENPGNALNKNFFITLKGLGDWRTLTGFNNYLLF